MEQAE